MSELDQRIRAVLAKLELLSEARAGTLGDVISRGASEASPPPDAWVDGRDGTRPPPKDRSLYSWYQWQFQNADEDWRRHALCFMAEKDYRERVHPLPEDRIAGRPDRDPEEERKLILDGCEGVSVVEVSFLWRVPPGWVRTIRERAGRRAEDGTERPRTWFELSQAQREEAVMRMKLDRHSFSQIAEHLGAAKTTVQRVYKQAIEKHTSRAA